MHLLLALLLACSGDDEAPPPAPAPQTDVCCEPGEPGEARWESCADKTVLEHVCKRAEICCTVQWAEPCAGGYARFAATCAVEPSGAEPSADGAAPNASDAQPGRAEAPQTTEDKLVSLEDADRVKVKLIVEMDPPPETPGGHVFYGGFLDIDEKVGMPARDAKPADYGSVGRWVQEFPVSAELELVDGLHYFVMYGFGEHPQPGDRMTTLQKVSGAGELSYVIGPRTIPKEDEVPEGGYAPGAEPSSPPDGEASERREEEPPPPPPPPPSGEEGIPAADEVADPDKVPPPPGEPTDGSERPAEGPDAGAPPDGTAPPPPGEGEPPGEPVPGG